jgi:hypothetical protein
VQLVCYVDRKDLHFLSTPSGYSKTDGSQYVPSIKKFLEALGIGYTNPFVCFSAVPDSCDPNDSTTFLAHFGNTPLMLRPEIADEVMLACTNDLQTTAYNGWKNRSGDRVSDTYRRMIRDLRQATNEQRREHLSSLSHQFASNSYAEVRIYRAITWNDIVEGCRKQFQGIEFDCIESPKLSP